MSVENFGIGKSLDDILEYIEKYFPENSFAFSGGALNPSLAYNRREYIKRLFGMEALNTLELLDYVKQGLSLNINSIFLQEFEKEYKVPDDFFYDISTNEKRIANILLKQLYSQVYGFQSDSQIGIIEYLKLAGIEIEVVERSDTTTGGFEKEFPHLFSPYGKGVRFIIYIRILNNSLNYPVDFIIKLVQSMVGATDLVVNIT
jgi:hypothetical protein